MSYNIVFNQGTATVTVPAAESIAVQSYSATSVFNEVGFPNFPEVQDLLGVVENETTVFGPYAAGATIVIQAGASGATYAVGTDPVISDDGKFQTQGTPGVLNATGTITPAMILSGILTSTTAAAVAGTLPTGAVLDAASEFAVGDSFDWSVIATGANAFTVTAAATGHTIVGTGAVATVTSAIWRTRKTAADTFVSYRLS
ncbi:hypothetical protein UFOVP774_26 [uncultured Caudovirales phage]|uniref:Uncharacterized protein n=1 Tax=uncultured Caudovirales phage TaxID=2100421 RepID=A0A6J5NQA7_9CAUD|nr:hypothetical protein UFOVP774_26 [uncultured Caudovirales phage]